MHFSRPSGCRLRMCRPWYRGAATGGSNGYWVVTTLRNMCAKVTPKPLNEPVKVPTSALLSVCLGDLGGTAAADRRRLALRGHPPQPWARRYLEVHRRYREAALRPRE